MVRCRYEIAEPASQLEVVARQLVSDDFDVAPDGRIYLATHFMNSVVQLDPAGTRATIAGPAQGVVGSTSVAIDPLDPNALLVTTTGGMKGPANRGTQPARLVRLRLDHTVSTVPASHIERFQSGAN